MAKKEKSQSEKFIETAKELDSDESGETFERAMKKIVPKREPSPKSDST